MSKTDDFRQSLRKQKEAAQEQLRRDFQEFVDHPMIYIGLLVSGLLSAMAGLTVGLSIRVENGDATYRSDAPHWIFAILLACLFPFVFEYGLAHWLHKLLHRENNNTLQQWTAIIMVGLTFIGTAITAFSAMDVLITALGFFSSFKEIPPSVQGWIGFSVPAMIMLNVAAGEVYRQSSEFAGLKREAEKELRARKMDSDLEIRLAQVEAERDVAIHQANEYSRRARENAPRIGQQRGEEGWRKDSQRLMPMVANAVETEQAKLADPTHPSQSQQD